MNPIHFKTSIAKGNFLQTPIACRLTATLTDFAAFCSCAGPGRYTARFQSDNYRSDMGIGHQIAINPNLSLSEGNLELDCCRKTGMIVMGFFSQFYVF